MRRRDKTLHFLSLPLPKRMESSVQERPHPPAWLRLCPRMRMTAPPLNAPMPEGGSAHAPNGWGLAPLVAVTRRSFGSEFKGGGWLKVIFSPQFFFFFGVVRTSK